MQLALVFGAVVFVWWPSLQLLATPAADQVWESFAIGQTCLAHPDELGWLGFGFPDRAATLFEPSLSGSILFQLACRFSLLSWLSPLQAYLLVGQFMTIVLATWSCRWAGFSRPASLICAFLMATAPCALSRIGHLGLSLLIPVVPSLLACLQLQRRMFGFGALHRVPFYGALAATLTFPAQEYYVVFGFLILLATWVLLWLLATTDGNVLRPLLRIGLRGGFFVVGYWFVLCLFFLPKLLAVGLPGLPASWSAVRLPIEQFRYGLLPFTWLIPPPWVSLVHDSLRQAGLDTASESYFWSAGSLLIPLGWLCAMRRLAQASISFNPVSSAFCLPRPGDRERRFLALLLLFVSALGMLCMTMGGLGTLFAVWVTPVLRSLNRYTVFVYGAAVLYLVAEFDFWLHRHEQGG